MFKTEVTYITRGHLSDTPGISPYVIVRTLTDGRKELRSLRTSSALEGMHHSMNCRRLNPQNSAQHSMAKHSGPRRKNASLRSLQLGWTVKAAIKAKMMPRIGHFQVHPRYRLIHIIKGTPHETRLPMVQGWPSVDLEKPSIVPRGVDCIGLLPREQGELPPPPAAAHSMMRAYE